MLKARRRNSDDDAVQHARLVVDVDRECVEHILLTSLRSSRKSDLLVFFVSFVVVQSAAVSTIGDGLPDHLVQIGARRHHRVDRVFLLDLEIDQRGALRAPRRFARRLRRRRAW